MSATRPAAADALLASHDVLRQMLVERTVHDEDGRAFPTHSNISLAHAQALHRAVLERRPRLVVEVGMAYGGSTLAILAALEALGGDGRLISIDPGQSSHYQGIGRLNVARAGLGERHTLLEEPDYVALPRLLAEGARCDLAYIDGWHTFDYTLVDFFFIDKMLAAGGVVAFNDCGMRAVHRVLGFVRTHRRYRELDVGLKADYTGRNAAYSLARRLLGIANQDRYFEKLEQWEPAWNFYRAF